MQRPPPTAMQDRLIGSVKVYINMAANAMCPMALRVRSLHPRTFNGDGSQAE
jgi:hypothetical protein